MTGFKVLVFTVLLFKMTTNNANLLWYQYSVVLRFFLILYQHLILNAELKNLVRARNRIRV